MPCLDSLIGIRGYCEDTTGDSGLFIQDLPMITFKNADAAVSTEQSGFKFLQDKIKMSGNYLMQDAVNLMAPYFRQSSVLENNVVGFYPENMKLVSGNNSFYQGIEVRIIEYPYIEFFLSQISLFIDKTGSVDIKIFDLKQNKLLDTIPISATAGEIVTIDVNKVYKTNKQVLDIFIGYDSTGINSYQTNLYGINSVSGCRGCGAGRSYGNQFIMFYPRKISTAKSILNMNMESINSTSGLSVTYSLNCNIEPFLCSIKNRMAMPALHRAGMEILRELQVSDRLSTVVVFQKKEIADTMLYFENEYKKGMNNVFANLQLPSDVCFKCNKIFGNGVAIP